MKRLIFILILLVIIFYFQYPFINKLNNTYEILQFDNPNKSIFEEILSEQKISVFTNIQTTFIFNNINLSDLYKQNLLHLQNNKQIQSLIKTNLEYYKIPLCINNTGILDYIDKNSIIKRQTKFRLLLLNIKNTCKITLFSPNQLHNLYTNNNISTIDITKPDFKKYPNLKNLTFIELLLHKNNMLYIPYKWFYSIQKIENNDTILVNYTNESIFSYLLKKN